MREPWWLYMLECRGGSIYVGVAKDVEARYQQHVKGSGAAYTRINPPLRLLGKMRYPDQRSAIVAEREMKKRPRTQKLLIAAELAAI